ncbi:hypothetical protein HF1_02770 [Mycoplasma haemofelis str. Langford 1]|uniref:Uncharacterized protein n=1 Tax=Mycoplasma haemofelis (strain Langford 1) TaxID=941640 RepID=E8ZGL4_MYCHL|nr:hypothetical protein [Mycoplasma haemofelis]CBY92285.1 hypothetical protein HF1_02770 [Mycoplasma haemofelis str. Langford 1]
MAISTTTKLVTGSLASCSVVGGGVLAGSKYFGKETEKKPITTLLKEKNPEKRLIAQSSTGSEAEWKEAWKSYLTSGSNVWSIEEGTKQPNGTDNAPTSFIQKCMENSEVKVENEQDTTYFQVLSYCTRDTLIKDLISGTKRLLVNSSDQDTEGWSASWSAYKSKNTNNQSGKDKWALDDWSQKHSESNVPESFKQKCGDKSSGKAYSQKSLVEDYSLVLEWCTTNS